MCTRTRNWVSSVRWFEAVEFLARNSLLTRYVHQNKGIAAAKQKVSLRSLWQDSQYVSDSPFLIGAVLNGQLETKLCLSALHQLQTTLRLCVLDGATLEGKAKKEKKRKWTPIFVGLFFNSGRMN